MSVNDAAIRRTIGPPTPPQAVRVDDLTIRFATPAGVLTAVDGISFSVAPGEVLGLVGESGSGKSITAQSLMGLLPMAGATLSHGRIELAGRDVTNLSDKAWRRLRGATVSMIFQDPLMSLNPAYRVGEQIAETLRKHRGFSRRGAEAQAVELLDRVGIRDPAARVRAYPHQLSGGMRQRVMIAIALACEPALLIADEPTTALDVTIQAQILSLIDRLRRETGAAVLFISHDLSVVAQLADRVAVMRKGQLVEEATAARLFDAPQHPYTIGLLAAVPDIDRPNNAHTANSKIDSDDVALLRARQITKRFTASGRGVGRRTITAVDGVDLEVRAGETLALVGESGSGKSTLGRLLMRLIEPDEGELRFRSTDVLSLDRRGVMAFRKKIQIVFQDPMASLNPRHTVLTTLTRPLSLHGKFESRKEARDKAAELLALVGLDADSLDRYPHEFSGGQRQRICIARSLSVEPELLICDESVSALDVTVQAQIVALLMDLRDRLGLTQVFIAHDLALVRNIADRVAVMSAGRIVEIGPTERVFSDPENAYTRELLSAVPRIGGDREARDALIRKYREGLNA